MNIIEWYRWPEKMTGMWRTGYTHGWARGFLMGLAIGLLFGMLFGWIIW